MNEIIEIREKKRLTYKKIKRFMIKILLIMLSLLVLASIGFASLLYFYNKNDKITLSNTQMELYIDSANDVSRGKLQVNWKYLATIDYVRYKKDLSSTSAESIKELGQAFLQSNDNIFKLNSFEDVLDELKFTNSEKEKAYKYIDQLEYVGLVPENLKEDSDTKKFIDELTPKAIELYKNYKILPSITISQAILESNWGKSELATSANNLFGIKADSSWKGKTVNMTTSEYYNTVIKDNFRSYDSIDNSLDDYGKFITENERYKESGVFNCSQYIDQAQAIENAGYSTVEDATGNSTYADLITSIIKQNNLQLIDSKVQSEE